MASFLLQPIDQSLFNLFFSSALSASATGACIQIDGGVGGGILPHDDCEIVLIGSARRDQRPRVARSFPINRSRGFPAQSGPFSTSCLKVSFLLGVRFGRSTGHFAVCKVSYAVAVVAMHLVAQGLAIHPAALCRRFMAQPFKHQRKRQNAPRGAGGGLAGASPVRSLRQPLPSQRRRPLSA